MSTSTRRQFLKLSAAGLAGVLPVVLSASAAAQPAPAQPSRPDVEAALLKLTKLGPNGRILRELIEQKLADIARLEADCQNLALAVLTEPVDAV